MCGRLLCCLKYEDQFYRRSARIFPRDGATVRTPEGEGKVVDLNFIRRTVVVEMEDERRLEFSLEAIKTSGHG
jgi:cell fate regulator YaaT (PSP1 superfamily)